MCFHIQGDLIFHGICYEKEELEIQKRNVRSFLEKSKVNEQEVVALSMTRSPLLLVTIFALLDESIPFLPLDVTIPEERLLYMLDQAEVKTIITDDNASHEFCGRKVVCIDKSVEDAVTTLKPIEVCKQELAYLLFTSGTTGLPKAVEIYRKGLENFITAIPEAIDFPLRSRVACFTSYTFDIFFLESIMALCQGMTVILADEEERSNPRKMQDLIRREHINVIQMTPSAFKMLQMVDENFSCLKEVETILVGGEVFPKQLLKSLQNNVNGRIYNMYGPTEATIWSMVADLTETDTIHIGRAVKNTEIFILDQNLKEVSKGQVGEIAIAGIGLARGYCNALDKTKQQFVYIERKGTKKRVYLTGDYGFLDSTGHYFFCGRRDNQVKILGHRIEIEDIEENVMKISEIQNAMVAVYGDDIKRLVCFYLANQLVPEELLRSSAKRYLPEYMVPGKWLLVPEFVYTASHKADRNAMIQRYLGDCAINNHMQKISMTTHEIFRIVKESLELEQATIQLEDAIAMHDIDSLNYIQMIVALEEHFNIEFDDEMLSINYFQTFKELVDYIVDVI